VRDSIITRQAALHRWSGVSTVKLAKTAAPIAFAAFIAPCWAWAAGDVAHGRALAQAWCANCHVVGENGAGKDIAPALTTVARRGAPDQVRARAFLAAPHPPMPNFSLSRQEIDDVVAYLNSLAAQ